MQTILKDYYLKVFFDIFAPFECNFQWFDF